jgi:hypothetical protein
LFVMPDLLPDVHVLLFFFGIRTRASDPLVAGQLMTFAVNHLYQTLRLDQSAVVVRRQIKLVQENDSAAFTTTCF